MKLVKWLLRWLNVFLVTGTIVAYLAIYISPNTFWPVSFFGLALPVFLVLNAIFLGIFIFIKEKRALWLNVLSLAIAFLFIGKWIGWNGTADTMPDAPIHVLSFNAQYFNQFEETAYKTSGATPAAFASAFDAYAPIFKNHQIVCLQEASLNNLTSAFQQYLKDEHQLTYHHQSSSSIQIFSQYPIINKGVVVGDEKRSNGCIFVDVKIDTSIFRVYNFHLASTGIAPEAAKVIENPDMENEDTKQSIRNILSLVKNANQQRAQQVQDILEHIEACPYPILLCGDMNDTPFSYAYHQLSKSMKDSFVERGSGMGITYNGPIPGLRIDYIFTSPDFSIYDHRVIRKNVSDHYAITSTLAL